MVTLLAVRMNRFLVCSVDSGFKWLRVILSIFFVLDSGACLNDHSPGLCVAFSVDCSFGLTINRLPLPMYLSGLNVFWSVSWSFLIVDITRIGRLLLVFQVADVHRAFLSAFLGSNFGNH